MAYDGAGNLIAETNALGETTRYEYDLRDRLVEQILPDGGKVNYSLTETGKISEATDLAGRIVFTYDAQDRILSRTNPDGTSISYAYDRAGNRTSVTSPGGTTNYIYDDLSRISMIASSTGTLASFTYDEVGNLVLTELPNGTREARTYDELNRLASVTTTTLNGSLIPSLITVEILAGWLLDCRKQWSHCFLCL